MRPPRFFHSRGVTIVLVLVLSILGFATLAGPIYVHAAAPTLVQTAQSSSGLCNTSCVVGWPGSVSIGDLIVVHTLCMGPQGATTVTDNAGSTFTRIVTAGGANPPQTSIWEAFARGGGNDAVTVTWTACAVTGNPVGAFSEEEFTGVASIGNTFTTGVNQVICNTSCTDTQSLTVTVSNALVYETFDVFNIQVAANCPTFTNGVSEITTQTLICVNNSVPGTYSQGRTLYNPNRGIGVNSFSMQASMLGASNSNGVLHTLLELDPAGGTPSNLGTQTACFGNCGNPAITLANTNSTHTVNFNGSIELFYQFQSSLNGQVLNITANVAKTYSNGNSLVLGVYTIPICNPGQPPFSPICPAALQKSSTIQNPQKGMNSFTNLAVPVSIGQWVGLAFTATFGGMDLNDTNTQVPMSQASDGGGTLNPTVSTSTTFSATSKIGLWSYLTGNTITGIPPPPTTGAANCSGILDCILPSVVFSLCANQTPQCQNASALVWALILSIVSLFFVFRAGGNLMPGIRIPIGEAFTLALLVWIFVLSGLQLLFVWVPLFFFFVAAVVFGKKTGTFL